MAPWRDDGAQPDERVDDDQLDRWAGGGGWGSGSVPVMDLVRLGVRKEFVRIAEPDTRRGGGAGGRMGGLGRFGPFSARRRGRHARLSGRCTVRASRVREGAGPGRSRSQAGRALGGAVRAVRGSTSGRGRGGVGRRVLRSDRDCDLRGWCNFMYIVFRSSVNRPFTC